MKTFLKILVLLAIVALSFLIFGILTPARADAVPVTPPTSFYNTLPYKTFDTTLERWCARIDSVLRNITVSGTFTPDTASIAGSNYALKRIARSDSLNLPYVPGIYNYMAILASRDSTVDTTGFGYMKARLLNVETNVAKFYASAESLLAANAAIDTMGYGYMKARLLNVETNLANQYKSLDSLLDLTRARLDAIALWDSTGNNAYSKQFAAGWDTIGAGDSLVVKLVSTNPYSNNYRIKEISFMILGDTTTVHYRGPSSIVAVGPNHYPGESFTWPVECDSVVFVSKPDVVPVEVEVRWWARGLR